MREKCDVHSRVLDVVRPWFRFLAANVHIGRAMLRHAFKPLAQVQRLLPERFGYNGSAECPNLFEEQRAKQENGASLRRKVFRARDDPTCAGHLRRHLKKHAAPCAHDVTPPGGVNAAFGAWASCTSEGEHSHIAYGHGLASEDEILRTDVIMTVVVFYGRLADDA